MKIHIIIHENFESPGAIETWARKNHHHVTYSKVYQFDSLPKDANDFDFLIVMGGPQSPATTLEECKYFNAKAEINLIKQAIKSEKLILGVCLGAQLLGEAFDAKFEHSPKKEIGVFDIHLTDEALSDPIFSRFPKSFLVGHWHADMPGISKGAAVLAYSKGCPRQIVRYTSKVYGFQCHFEFTKDAIKEMIKHCNHEIEAGKGLEYIQDSEKLMTMDYDGMNQLLFDFLDRLVIRHQSSKPLQSKINCKL